MKYYIGVDIGGTNTKIGILDDKFNILIEDRMKTLSKNGARETFKRIWNKVLELSKEINIKEEQIEGIGLGIPGPVENQSIVKIAANFSWGNNFDAKKLMEEITGKKVKVENDVRTIAIGEHLFGAGIGSSNLAVIPIGTGIAAGIILNNKIVSGSHGFAGEFGHIVVDKEGYKCGCGLTGCVETYVSATGLIRYGKKMMEEKKEGLMYERFKNSMNEFDAYHIFEYLYKDDIAMEVFDNFSDKLAYAISILLNTLNLDTIILAGGVAKSADIIIERVKEYLPKYTLSISLEGLQIKKSKLLDSAGIKGAAALILNN